MQPWKTVLAAVLPASILLLFFLIILRWRCWSKTAADFPVETTTRTKSLQSGIEKLQLAYNYSRNNTAGYHHQHHDLHNKSSRTKKSENEIAWRSGFSGKSYFDWADNPSLVSEAVENGWAGFAFLGFPPSPSSTVWNFCMVCDYGRESNAEITWEIGPRSADHMQRIRFDPRIRKRSTYSNNDLEVSSLRMGLPLPGPSLGDSSFPQVAYLEIIVEPAFISEAAMKGQFDVDVYHQLKSSKRLEESKFVNKEETRDSSEPTNTASTVGKLIWLGLAAGNASPSRFPGTFPGSIGFNSNGLVYLDGIVHLGRENRLAKKAVWGGAIGCGYEPAQKRVFFTVDSELVYTVYCQSDVFERPLFPTLAANFDATVLVNMGQSPFKYEPANAQRTPDPCFFRPFPANTDAAAFGFEDSRELFSMGRIDLQWRNRSSAGTNHNCSSSSKAVGQQHDECETDSEADLFEIVLDNHSNGR